MPPIKMRFLILFFFITSCFASNREVIAATIIREAGGEGEVGMQAVASVIQNRTTGKLTAYQVIMRPKQFSCLNGVKNYKAYVLKSKRHTQWKFALELARKLESKNVEDITNGATHYHSIEVNPKWARKLEFKVQVGNHLFYEEKA